MQLKFRQATREDLPEIVRILADDFLGARHFYENLDFKNSYLRMKLHLK